VDTQKPSLSLRALRYAAGAVAVLAAGALVLSLLVDGDEDEPDPSPPGPKLIERLAKPVQTEAVEVAKSDATVRQLVGKRQIEDTHAAPWVAEGGTELLGSSVRLQLDEPLRLDEVKLPTYVWPSRDAPPSTPSLRRYARFDATGVTELRILMRLPSKEVLEIAPEGPTAVVIDAHLLGPPLSKDYQESGGY
jgi:hypothetical protein